MSFAAPGTVNCYIIYFIFKILDQARVANSSKCSIYIQISSLEIKRHRDRLSRPAHLFVKIWSCKYFYGHSSSSADSRRALSVNDERMCATYW